MKKATLILLFTLATIGSALYSKYETTSRLYPKSFEVCDIDKAADTITLIDCNGYTWEVYGVDDWQTGDKANAIMDNQDTQSIFDDKIVTLQYTR